MTDLLALRAAARSRSAGDYAGTIRAYYPYWDAQYRPYLIEAVKRFPVEQLDYKPQPDMLTSRQTILHIAEAERSWIHAAIDGHPEDEDWVSQADDPAQGWRSTVGAPDHAELLERLERWHEPTQRWLERPPADLGRIVRRRLPDGSERTYTVHWILDHVQEHEIHHRAQLNLYLRMLGIAPPSI